MTKYKKLEINPEEVAKKNSACYGLAMWMNALTAFCDHIGYLDVKKRSKYGPKAGQRIETNAYDWKSTLNSNDVNKDLMTRWPQ